MKQRDLPVLAVAVALTGGACGPTPTDPVATHPVAGAFQVGLGGDGDYLAFGGGRETTNPEADGLAISRISPTGERRYVTDLPFEGAADAWPIALRIADDDTVWALATEYAWSPVDFSVRSEVHRLDASGSLAWRLPIRDELGPAEAFDLEPGPDGAVLIAAGARLLTVDRDGQVVSASDVATAYGIRIEELEPLGDGRLAVLGYPGLDYASPPRLLVLDAAGAVTWTRALQGELHGRDTLLADGAGGLVVVESIPGSDLHAITALDAAGVVRWSATDDVGTIVVTTPGVAHTRTAPTSDNRDDEGYPEDVGVFLVRRDDQGAVVAETYLDDLEQLALSDCAVTRDGALLFGGRRPDDDGPTLFVFE